MLRDIKAAYKGWVAIVGILISAVPLVSFIIRAMDMSLAGFMREIVGTYRALFHPLIDLLTLPLPFALTDLQKDLVAVWLAIGGATSRTYWSEFAENRRLARDPDSIRRSDHWESLRLALLSVLVWPVGAFFLFQRPYYYAHMGRDGRPLFVGRWHRSRMSDDHKIIADMRVVLLVQLLSVIAVVLILVVANTIGLQ